MSFRFLLPVIFLLAFARFSTAQDFVLTPDSDYYGFDLRTELDMTLEQCQAECLADPQCRAFTHNANNGRCFLKSDFGTIQPFRGATAGRIAMHAGSADLGAPPRLSFVPDYLSDEAVTYRTELLRTVSANAESGFSMQEQLGRLALAQGNAIGALEHLRAALAIAPDASAVWSALSEAARAAGGQQGVDSWQMRTTATAAALNAYQTSRSAEERAAALKQLGYALEWRQMFRPAINAYAASLELVDDPAVRAQYQDLRQRQGFRVVDHTIDSDSRTPRVCVQFSEPLLRSGVDYSGFVTLDGRATDNVTAGERELCVEGLQHGQRYRLALRAGLPSSVGETLQAPVALELYIRDRTPFVRFTGENFVLPAQGRQSIPIVTVNAAAVELTLYRIGERGLAQVLADSKFLSQLNGFELTTLAEESGEKIWQGVLETPIEQNREVVSSLAIDQVLPERRPGIHVLSASVEGAPVEDWDSRATQWFVISDIGLAAYSGEDGVEVHARSLASAEPLAGIALQLVARNNEVLGETTTGEDGVARFAAGLARGVGGMAPQHVSARGPDGDFAFLDMARAGFDFSDRGVEGRPSPGAIDVMVWTERGIYRPGEEIHVTALARDDSANAVGGLPLTFVLTRPDGVEFGRVASTEPTLGGHYLSQRLPDNAMRGAWTLAVHDDPGRPPLASKPFLVEDFVPDRIEFDLTADQAAARPGDSLALSVEGRFLYGAPAAGLVLEGELLVRPSQQWDAFPGFLFGLADERDETGTRISLGALPALDEAGRAGFSVSLDSLPSTTRLLAADVTVRLREGGGRAVERKLAVPLLPRNVMIGIAPAFGGNAVPENSQAAFRIIAIDTEGRRTALAGASWTLLKIERDFQWYRQGSSWNYEAVDYTTQVADGEIDVGAGDPARLEVPVGWGRYRLEVEAPDGGGITSVEFDAGWHVAARSTDTPDGLEMSLDREVYRPGDVARLRVSPRFGGKLVVVAGAERILTTIQAEIPEEGGTVEIPIGDDWGAGAYLTATLYRPAGDDGSRLPMRAIGVKWLGIDPGERRLSVQIEAPEQVRPRDRLEIPVRISGAGAGEEAYVTLAAVDVGILNLTRYEAPDPDGWYFGQRQLGLQMRDLYGRLIDGSAGVPGRLRSGGDGPAMAIEGSPPTERLVAFHSGIVELDADGRAVIGFDLPQFNGTVRLMAVAWTGSGVGHATRDVVVRDPVVVTASLPRFLAPGDIAELRLELALADAPAGEYEVEITADGAARIDSGLARIELTGQGRAAHVARIEGIRPGTAGISIVLEGADGLRLEQLHEIPVRPANPAMPERREIELAANGGSLRLDRGLLDGHHLEDASVTVAVTPLQALDVPALLMSLDRYPYGCTEQVTSRAMPLLYVAELAQKAGLEQDAQASLRIDDAVQRVLSNQSASGSFGLWGPGAGDLWLDAYVSDFLTRAREQGHAVPDTAMRLALDNLQNTLAYTTDIESEGPAMAYALYVLARNRRASAGDLRYYADTQIDAFPTPMARAQVGASLALYGDGQRAGQAFAAALRMAQQGEGPDLNRQDYGSDLRDNAALMALAAESRQYRPEMARLVSDSLAGRDRASTQEQAWMLLAARAVESAGIALSVNGQEHAGSYSASLSGPELAQSALVIVNRSPEPVTAVVTTVASPDSPLPAGGNGFSIERSYFSMSGEPVNIGEARQNERYVAVLRIVEENAWPSRILVSDLLPAGFEIDNPALVSSASLAGFDWLPETETAHLEFRDDRFVAALDRSDDSSRDFTLAYVVRAVTPGTFAHPPAIVEDMYRPQFSARTAASVLTVAAP